MAKRAAEAGGGLAAAVKAIAVDGAQKNQADYRQRVRDSHVLGMKTLGYDVEPATSDDEDDGMGVIVTGDIYGDAALDMLRSRSTTQSDEVETEKHAAPQQPTAMSTAAKVATALAGAVLLGPGSIGVAALSGAFDKTEQAAVVQPIDTDTATSIEAVQIYGTDK